MRFQKTRLVIIGLLLIFFAQLLNAAVSLSATIDEGFHITSGYEYLRTGRVRLFDEHPPLAKALFAWPLLLIPDLVPPERASAYAAGDLIAVTQATTLAYTPIDRVIVACRVPVALLCVLLAAGVYRLARKLAGNRSALLALAFFTFDPNILAHGSLATTDLGSTAFIFWTLGALYTYLRAPTRTKWWGVAILLGLAQLTKLTAIALVPVCGVAFVLHAWFHAHDKRSGALFNAALSYVGMVAVAALVVWLGYGLEVRPVSTIAHGTLPLPAAGHIERWERLRANLAYGRESFLLGQNRMHGWPQYFPIAFLIKTPLPTLILGVWAVLRCGLQVAGYKLQVTGCRSQVLTRIQRVLPLILFPVLYVVSSLTSTINIGYRHLLPILPLLYVGIGVGNREYGVGSRKRAGRIANGERRIANGERRMANGERRMANSELRITNYASRIFPYSLLLTPYSLLLTLYSLLLTLYSLLLTWLIIGTLAVAPHFLTFFNEIAGGPENGWRFLADSNTDWGQALKALAAYQRENETGPVYLSQFTFLDPATYGVAYIPIAPMSGAEPVLPRRFNPAPGLYAISATTLDGVPLGDPEMYDWFRWKTPNIQIANALHFYHVTPDEVTVTWIAQCQTPVAPLNDAIIVEGFGISEVRRVDFDCRQSWIIPSHNNPSSGRYILHGALLRDTFKSRLHYAAPSTDDPFIARRLMALHIVYRQQMNRSEPTFAIYTSTADIVIPSSNAWPARADTSPTILTTQAPIAAPIALDGALTFLGAAAYLQQNALDVETWWRVTGAASMRPLSIMAHLLTKSGEVKGIADGLGVPASTWQAGDIFVQRHVFSLPTSDTHTGYILRTGVYWADDGTRWHIATVTEADAIFVALTPTTEP